MSQEGEKIFVPQLRGERSISWERVSNLWQTLRSFLLGARVRSSVETDFEIIRAQIIFNQFSKFIHNTPGFKVENLEEFVAMVNHHFTLFEKEAEYKLDIDKLAARRSISCTGASLLLGIWYEQVFGIQPLYLIMLGDNEQQPGKYAHTAVFLTEVNYHSTEKMNRRIYLNCRDLKALDGAVFEYYVNPQLEKSHLPMCRNYRVYGNLAYIIERQRLLDQ
ncbi:MAG TPA: hypothetical protein PKX78_01030 [Candidatus Woesebacteria bacterium]|nr:hypothetical protein [Candidatus Woesebacteria bacterium]